jgi:hypothetical protein
MFNVSHVLAKLLVTLLTTPISAIVSLHGLLHHFYADDSQLYIVFNPRDSLSRDEAVAKMCKRHKEMDDQQLS